MGKVDQVNPQRIIARLGVYIDLSSIVCDSLDLTGLFRPTQTIRWPRLSTSGFTPKSLPRESAQLSRAGRGRLFCFI